MGIQRGTSLIERLTRHHQELQQHAHTYKQARDTTTSGLPLYPRGVFSEQVGLCGMGDGKIMVAIPARAIALLGFEEIRVMYTVEEASAQTGGAWGRNVLLNKLRVATLYIQVAPTSTPVGYLHGRFETTASVTTTFQ